MVHRRQQIKFERKDRARVDRATGMRNEFTVDGSPVNHWVTPVVEGYALGNELRAEAVGGTPDRIDLEPKAHFDDPDVRNCRSVMRRSEIRVVTGSRRDGVGRTPSSGQ
jgi:hypothetical protein